MGHSRDSYTASDVLLIPTNHTMRGIQLWLIREYIYNKDIQDCGILGRLTLFGVCDIILALVIIRLCSYHIYI